MAAGFLRTVDNFCIDCNGQIDVCVERNYIVYDSDNQISKRQCAKCHDGDIKVCKTVTPHRDYYPFPGTPEGTKIVT